MGNTYNIVTLQALNCCMSLSLNFFLLREGGVCD